MVKVVSLPAHNGITLLCVLFKNNTRRFLVEVDHTFTALSPALNDFSLEKKDKIAAQMISPCHFCSKFLSKALDLRVIAGCGGIRRVCFASGLCVSQCRGGMGDGWPFRKSKYSSSSAYVRLTSLPSPPPPFPPPLPFT